MVSVVKENHTAKTDQDRKRLSDSTRHWQAWRFNSCVCVRSQKRRKKQKQCTVIKKIKGKKQKEKKRN
jgi:hypothetical protein